MAVLAGEAVDGGGQRAVGGVAQCTAGGDGHVYFQCTGEELVRQRHLGHVDLLGGIGGVGVARAKGGLGGERPIVAAVCRAGIRGAVYGLRVFLAGHEGAVGGTDVEGAAIGVEFERHVGVLQKVVVKPHHLISTGGDGAHACRSFPFGEVGGIVAEVTACQGHLGVAGVVEFYPSVEVDGGAEILVNVGRHDFIDNQ